MREFGRNLRNLAILSSATTAVMELTQHNPYVEVGVPTVGVALGKGTDIVLHHNEDLLGREYSTGVSWVVRGLSIASSAFAWRLMGPNEITLFFTGVAVGSTEKAIRNGLSAGTDRFRYRRMGRRYTK